MLPIVSIARLADERFLSVWEEAAMVEILTLFDGDDFSYLGQFHQPERMRAFARRDSDLARH